MCENGSSSNMQVQLWAISCLVEGFLDRVLLERVGGRVVKMSSLLVFILLFPRLVYDGEVPEQGAVRVSYMYVCMCYEKYPSGIMIVHSWLRPSGAIIIPSWYSHSTYK